MIRVNPWPSASGSSSRRGQIVESEWPPPSPGGSNRPDGQPSSPPGAVGSDDDEEFGVRRTPKRACCRAESGVDADRAAAGGGGGTDRISELPDAVLLSVLSYLPLRDAGRTMVLSKRWRGLFDQSLLDFNARQPFPPEEGRGCEWMIGAVTDILAARPNLRVRSFHFVMYGRGFNGSGYVVDGWFRTLAFRGVRELDVDMFYATPKPPLPCSLLALASLETLKVNCCRFPDFEPPPRLLPILRTLHLCNVTVSRHSLQAMLTHCTSLECVKLKNVVGVEKICLRSKSLARLYGDFGGFKELVIEDAPNLEEFVGIDIPNNGKAFVKIAFAPKLQVLGYLGINPLVLHDTVFDGGIVQLTTLMRSVKTLAIQVPFSEKGYSVFVPQLLKCFPCLEVLHVEPDKRSVCRQFDVERWDTASSIQCIENSVKKVVFEYFIGGDPCQWGFLMFLLRMAKALKLVELYCWGDENWASIQVEPMGSINRDFPGVDFRFFNICKPVKELYLCHCCPRRCQKEKEGEAIQVSHAESHSG